MKMGLLRRRDLTMQWLRLASRAGKKWVEGFAQAFRLSEGELWQTDADCELQLYQDSRGVGRRALTEKGADEQAKDRDVASLRANILAIQGSLLHSQYALGEQNLAFEKFGVTA
jgi:hypothetical protein